MIEDNSSANNEHAIAKLLHYGTGLASTIIAIGLVIQWLHTLLTSTMLGLAGHNLVQVGVAIFIVLPVLRVALMLFQFAQARDIAYVTISALVLVIIGAGFLVGLSRL
ncbi:DUF1634 domain-containing protein [Brucella sp. 10RB9213]|uniref:DUF1634 domain-containing protein n=1 Tax=Brucella sp. 10RB9213 TaxID=1844039 RepID=UPI0012AE3EDE|nr:DUF1634 domain-containing protein [Brucella sp. 10RB9213]MRN66289.1 DUF1634 domain-containing protein [Brucella sp. 10RB9213]